METKDLKTDKVEAKAVAPSAVGTNRPVPPKPNDNREHLVEVTDPRGHWDSDEFYPEGSKFWTDANTLRYLVERKVVKAG